MALDKQLVPVIFAQGVDTKTDRKAVSGKMLELENSVFIAPGRYQKRNGHIIKGRAGTVGKALSTFKDELVSFDGSNLFSYVEASDSFISKGQTFTFQECISTKVETMPVVSNAYSQTSAAMCFHPLGIYAYVWEDSRGGLRYSVYDAATEQAVVNDVVLAEIGTHPKIFALGNYIVITYIDTSSHLVYVYFPASNLESYAYSEPVEMGTDLNATITYDAAIIGQRLFFTYNTNDTSIYVNWLNTTLHQGGGYTQDTEVATRITIFGGTREYVWVWYYNGTKLKAFVLSYELLLAGAPLEIATVANVRNITGTVITDPTETSNLYYEVTATDQINYTVGLVGALFYSNAVHLQGAGIVMRSVGLASKAFILPGGTKANVLLTYASATQPTYFLMSGAPYLIRAKIAPGLGAGLTARIILPDVIALSDSKFAFVVGKKISLEVEQGTVFSNTGLISFTVDFDSELAYQTAVAGNNLLIGGGLINMYDGASVVEFGFNLYPEQATVTKATSAGALAAGTYGYSIVYEWTDNQGQIHYSAPSIAQNVVVGTGSSKTFTATTTSGSPTLTSVSSETDLFIGQLITGTNIPANTYIIAFPSGSSITMSNNATGSGSTITITTVYTNKNTLAIPTLRITAKNSYTMSRNDVSIVVYRTQANGTVFYRVSSIASPLLNDISIDTVSFVDTVADLFLTGNELLYTTGGVLENIAPPAATLLTNYRNKIMLVPDEDGNSFWISKAASEGVPIAFSDFFVKPVNPDGGKITALAQLDDKAIIFKRNFIYETTGDGPNDVGQNDDMQTAQLVTTDVGCINPKSIVRTPEGLMFQSGKGIYLLDRSLSVSYVGAPVEKYNDSTVMGAELVPNTNQVRFITSENRSLVYDYFFKQWSIFTGIQATSSAIFENLFCYLTASGDVFQESIGAYLDGGRPINLRAKTSWLQFAGINGFQRIYQLMILGEYKSLHRMRVQIAYEFDDAPKQEVYINAGELLQPVAYGDVSPYGAEEVYGGEYPLYRFRVDTIVQKCQAVSIILQEVQGLDYGEGCSLNGITCVVGIKKGLVKIPATRQFG